MSKADILHVHIIFIVLLSIQFNVLKLSYNSMMSFSNKEFSIHLL